MFEGGMQHDAQEFLRCLQCYLQDAEKAVQKFCNLLPKRPTPVKHVPPVNSEVAYNKQLMKEAKNLDFSLDGPKIADTAGIMDEIVESAVFPSASLECNDLLQQASQSENSNSVLSTIHKTNEQQSRMKNTRGRQTNKDIAGDSKVKAEKNVIEEDEKELVSVLENDRDHKVMKSYSTGRKRSSLSQFGRSMSEKLFDQVMAVDEGEKKMDIESGESSPSKSKRVCNSGAIKSESDDISVKLHRNSEKMEIDNIENQKTGSDKPDVVNAKSNVENTHQGLFVHYKVENENLLESDSDDEDIIEQKKRAKLLYEMPRRSPRKLASDPNLATSPRTTASPMKLSQSDSLLKSVTKKLSFNAFGNLGRNTNANLVPVVCLENCDRVLPENRITVSASYASQLLCSPTTLNNIDGRSVSNTLSNLSNGSPSTTTDPTYPFRESLQPSNMEPANTEPNNTEPANTELANTEPANTEPANTDTIIESNNYMKCRSSSSQLYTEEYLKAIEDMINSPIKSRSKFDIMERLFQGSMMLRTRCRQCESSWEREEDFHDISVPIRLEQRDSDSDDEGEEKDRKPPGLLDLIAASTEVEALVADNQYFCDECKSYTDAERSLHYDVIPNILTVHLKRFSTEPNNPCRICKLNDPISIPLILPCLKYKCLSSCVRPDHRSKLYGIITHSGVSPTFGHYKCYVRSLSALANPTMEAEDLLANNTSEGRDISNTSSTPGTVTRNKAGVSTKLPSRFNENFIANTKVKLFESVAPKVKSDVTELLKPTSKFSTQWFELDDESVRVFEESEFEEMLSGESGQLLGTPYLLFYHKATLC